MNDVKKRTAATVLERCPDCGGELIHGGMGIPLYDCSQCEEMWLVQDGVIAQRVTEGCPIPEVAPSPRGAGRPGKKG